MFSFFSGFSVSVGYRVDGSNVSGFGFVFSFGFGFRFGFRFVLWLGFSFSNFFFSCKVLIESLGVFCF